MTITIHDFEQYSPEWWQARLGIPTASEFSKVLAKGEGKTRRKYQMQLLGERITGEPAETYNNAHMERGKAMEAEARDLYAFRTGAEPVAVGFIRRAEKWGDVGGSPDSLIGEHGLLEIKTKLADIQAEVLLADKVPPEHTAQLQGLLWVSGRQWVDFVSYWPKMPLFVRRVTRDEEYIVRLEAEVSLFSREIVTYLGHLTS